MGLSSIILKTKVGKKLLKKKPPGTGPRPFKPVGVKHDANVALRKKLGLGEPQDTMKQAVDVVKPQAPAVAQPVAAQPEVLDPAEAERKRKAALAAAGGPRTILG